MTNTITNQPAAWVGCLACYNAGRLIGDWFDTADEIRSYTCPISDDHEEMWVFDHQCMPGLVGECSPTQFADMLDVYDGVHHMYDIDAVIAYCDNQHQTLDQFDADHFDRCYVGWYENGIDGWVDDYIDMLADEHGLRDIKVLYDIGIDSYVDTDQIVNDLRHSGWWSVNGHVFNEH